MKSAFLAHVFLAGEARPKSLCRSTRICRWGRPGTVSARSGKGIRVGTDDSSGSEDINSHCNRYMERRWSIRGCHSGTLASLANSAAKSWPWRKSVSIRFLGSAGYEHSGAYVCRKRLGLCGLLRSRSVSQRGSRQQLDENWPGCDRSVYSNAHHGEGRRNLRRNFPWRGLSFARSREELAGDQ